MPLMIRVAMLLGTGWAWGTWACLAGWALAVLGVFLATRRLWRELLGPVLLWELVRQARRGRFVTLRVLYLAVLLIVLGVLYLDWFGTRATLWETLTTEERIAPARLASFSQSFFTAFLAVQLGAVLLLTPGMTAGAIAEEKERRTLDFLLVTHLPHGGLVVGKLLARLGGLFLMLLAGLPVLALLQFLGGVDPHLLLAGFACTLLTMLGLGSVGILQSTQAPRPRTAIVRTYVIAGAYLLGTSLFCAPAFTGPGVPTQNLSIERLILLPLAGNPLLAFLRVGQGLAGGGTPETVLPPIVLEFAVFHGLLAGWCLFAASRSLREPDQTLLIHGVLLPNSPTAAIAAAAPPATPDPPAPVLRERPPVDDRPVLWKERYTEPGWEIDPITGFFILPVAFLFLFGAGITLALILIVGLGLGELDQLMEVWLSWVLTPIATLACLAVAVRAAGMFTSERERQTLDSLLITDLTNGEIVRQKWLASVLQPLTAWCSLLALYFLGCVCGGVSWSGMVLLPLAIVAHACLAASLGLACSLTSATSWQATVRTLLVLGLLTLGPWGVSGIVGVFGDLSAAEEVRLARFLSAGLSPPLTLVRAIQGHDSGAVLAGLAAYGLLAVLLYAVVRVRFPAITGRRG
jgi:ABC-type transport system involved in multi-copper enzyme maturation permease subunit